MITKENLKEVLRILGFKESKHGVFVKHYSANPAHSPITMQVDFTRERLIYPQDLLVESEQVTGFTTTDGKARNENFVVFECVHRLLEQGYKPEDLVLEKTWRLGHTGKSGRADITIYKEAEDTKEKFVYAIIECKTAGKEYTKAKQDLFTNEEGNQLFSYAAQARSVEWLCLYASDFDANMKSISYKDELIQFKDDDNVLNLALSDTSIQTFKQASEASDIFSTWEDTYNKQSYHDLIFKSQAYNIGVLPLYKKDLKPFDESDGLNLKFREILRHNKVSNRNTAFDVLLAIFLAKCYDEKKNDNERLEFYYNPFSDDYFSLYKRLKGLFISAMREFLNEEVFFVADDLVEKTFKDYFHTNRKQAQKVLEDAISDAQNYSAQFFAFKKVYNKKLFNQNGKILVEVVQLFENYLLLYANKNQFISDLFEHFLNEGFTQNEGIYFTPMPITRFIWNSLPFEDFVNLRNKTFPKVIDFACGAGHFLTEGVSAISDYCKDRLSIEDIEISRYFYGIDADDRLAMTSQVSMLLNGAGGNKIRFIDGLEYDKEFYGENQQDFDILVANPPYSVKEFKQHLSRSVLKGKNGNIPYKVLEHLSPNAKEIENVFVERLTHILKPKALCAIILPNSILSNTDKSTTLARELILQNFAIHAICSFGSQTFGTTGTNTAVLFLRRFDEPPKITELLEDSLSAIFNNQNLENFKDKEILQSYVAFQNIDLQDYKAFLKQEQIPSHELFKEYETAFNKQSKIKDYKESKGFKDLDKKAQEQELEKRLFDFCFQMEREKLKYFALTYKQNTLIVKSPDDTAEQKRFLGFVINKSKTSNAGLQESEGLLSDRDNRNAEDKIAYAIKQSFKNEFHTHEAFSKYVGFTQTCRLLTFDNAVFNKAINPLITSNQGEGKAQNPFENCKFELVKISEIILENPKSKIQVREAKENTMGAYPFYTSGTNIYRYDEALISGENIYLSTGGNAIVQFYNGESAYSTDTYTIKANAKMLTKFLFYILQMQQNYINTFLFKGTGLKHLQKQDFKNLKIPLPPLEIQKQIVSECEKVEEQHSLITQSIEAYQNLIKAILAKCKISDSLPSVIAPREANNKILHATDSIPSRHSEVLAEESTSTESKHTTSSKATDLITVLLDSIQELESKLLTLTFQDTNADDLNALLHSLPTPPTHGWDRVKISHIAQISRGASPRPINNFLTTDSSGVNWIKIGDVAEGAKYITKTEQKITQAGAEKSKRVKAGDFILSNSMSAGRPYILKIDGCIHDGWLLLSHISDRLSKDFLYYALLSDETQRQFDQRARGSVVKNLNTDLVASVKIPLPPLEAQEKIIEAIEAVEVKITQARAQEQSLESSKEQILARFLNA